MVSRGTLRRAVVGGLVGLVVLVAPLGGTPEGVAAPGVETPPEPTAAQQVALRAGLQVAPKVSPHARRAGGPAQPDPSRATLTSLLKADYSGWLDRNALAADRRMASSARTEAGAGRTGSASRATLKHTEVEPAAAAGRERHAGHRRAAEGLRHRTR